MQASWLSAWGRFGMFSVKGQRISFEKDTIDITAGHSFSNRLYLKNTSPAKLRLLLDHASTARGGYLNLPDTLDLAPGENKTIPLKFLASAGLIRQALQAFTVRYRVTRAPGSPDAEGPRTDNPAAVAAATFYTRLDEEARILLQLSEQTAVLDPISRETPITLFLGNEGLLTRTVHLRFAISPQGLEVREMQQPQALAGGTRQALTFTLHQQGKNNGGSDFRVAIQALDDSARVLANVDLSVETLTGSRRVFSPGTAVPWPGNSLELNYINMAPYTSYYQLRARGGTWLGDSSRLDYRLNFEYYTQPRGVNVYDSWLAYINPHFALRAGSISDNLDYSLNGNGMQASAYLDKHSSIDLYGLRNDYLLFTQITPTLPAADIVAARYRWNDTSSRTQVSVLHASDPLLGVLTNLVHAEEQLQLGTRRSLQAEAGFSNETPLDGPGNHYGYAAGFRYREQDSVYTLALSNYYSSPYYSGYRRGALQLDDEADYRHFFLRYSKAYSAPKYTPTADSLQLIPFNYNNTNIYEAGYRFLHPRWSVVVRPYYMDQRIYSALPQTSIPLHSGSDRLAVDLNASGRGRSLYTTADIGYTSADSAQHFIRHYSSVRILGNYMDRWWSFNWLLQWHPYYLTDELQSPNPAAFRLYSFGPSVYFRFLQDRLVTTGGYIYNYYSDGNSRSQVLSAQATLKLRDNWAVNGQLYYTFYRSTLTADPISRQVRIGLQKQFASSRQPGTVNLKLMLFRDRNSNGAPDKGEPAAPHVIVRLDGQAALSNGQGEVEFFNLPAGIHQLTIDNSADWNLPQPWSLPLLHSETIRVPLVQSGQIKGRIMIRKQQFENREPDPEGITVLATGPEGKTWSTLTDGSGQFHFYLPVADYALSVPPVAGMVEGASAQKVSVAGGATVNTEFQLEDHRRNIKVSQF